MSRFISTLLAKEKSVLESTLSRLEEASGHLAVDARLTSEIVVEAKNKMRQLGLDPSDTTGPELYHALVNLTGLHDGFLAKTLSISDSSDPTKVLPKVSKTASKIASSRQVWALRHSVAKRLLKEQAPKQLMKHLGYRSLESMLKRESIDELFAGARAVESKDWQKGFYQSFTELHPSDFELRSMSVKYPSAKRWSKLSTEYVAKKHDNIVELKEFGSVVILPFDQVKLEGITLAVLAKVLHTLNELKLYSGYLKFIQVQDNFGKALKESLVHGPASHTNIAGEDLRWKTIHGYLAGSGSADTFDPYVQADDLNFEAIEETLYKIEPALHFWYGTTSLGLPYDDYSVSFNLLDMTSNYVNKFPVAKSSSSYLQEALWAEMLKRYLSEQPMQEQVTQQLDNLLSQDEYSDETVGGVALA